MTNTRKAHRLAAFLATFLALAALSLAADLRIEVMVRSANVRLKPAMDAPVVGSAQMGLVLRVEKKEGEWYLVELPADANRAAVSGYIHNSVVREVNVTSPDARPAVEPKPAPARREAVKPKPAAVRTRAVRSPSARRKVYVRIGAGYGTKSFDYNRSQSFAMYGETASVTEHYAVDASGVAFDAGIGFLFTPSLGVELSFVPASGKSKGTFTGEFPHPFYFNLFRNKEWSADDLKYSSSEVNLDVVYAFPATSRIGLYVCAGGTYFLGVKIDSLKAANWAEIGYPYLDINVNPQYAKYSASAFGFNAGAGIDYRLSPAIAINLNARYSSGTAKIKIEGTEVSIPAGGLRATAGLKFLF